MIEIENALLLIFGVIIFFLVIIIANLYDRLRQLTEKKLIE